MKIAQIRTYPMSCVGCLLCQLSCSFTHEKEFNPSKSRIMIDRTGVGSKIGFADNCTKCGVCVEHCLYGVLENVEQESRDAES